MISRPQTLADLATDAAVRVDSGPEALTALESELQEYAKLALEAKGEADKAGQALIKLSQVEAQNREERAILRAAHAKDNTLDLVTWQKGSKDDYAKQAARFTAQASQLAWLSKRDDFAVNFLRPNLQLARLRKDAAFAIASADTMFCEAAIAAYQRHESMQKTMDVDGVAQIPAAEGKTNALWRKATALLGRGAELSQAADVLAAQIETRQGNL